MHSNLQRSIVILALVSTGVFALKGTRGTPLGGMGTGYVGFDATKGNFYASGKTPPAAADITQVIKVSYDKPVKFKELVFKNNTGVDIPAVYVNGTLESGVKAEGSAYEKNIRVTLANELSIGPDGVEVKVSKVPIKAIASRQNASRTSTAFLSSVLAKGRLFNFSVAFEGTATIEILSLNGVKLGTILNGTVTAGRHSVAWNGTTLEGFSLGNQTVLVKLVTPTSSTAQRIIVLE